MNLIEALKTGRRIRRKSWIYEAGGIDEWMPANPDMYAFVDWGMDGEDVLADDWEIEPEPKKKVKHWLWVYDYKAEFKKDYLLDQFLTEEQAKQYGKEFEYENMRKLLWSETEFEE